MKLSPFVQAYIECALWSSNDNSDPQGGDPLDQNYSLDDIASETLADMQSDCLDFQRANADDLTETGASAAQQGHDFWLTRNRHGAGFWDRGYGILGERLTDAAHVYGSYDLYIGDDGRVYGQ